LSYFINKEYQSFLLTRFIYICGIKMTPTILGWKLYEMTGSKLALGILGLSEVVPAVLLALPAGVKIDRSDKHKLMSYCLMAYLAIMLFLLYITSSNFVKLGSTAVISNLIFFGVFLTGAVRAYSSPTLSAFIPQLVNPDDLVRAASLSSMAYLMESISGPIIAGLLIGVSSVTNAFIVVCVLISAGLVNWYRIKPKPVIWGDTTKKTWEGVKEGLVYVYHQKILLGSMTLDMLAVLFGGAIALLPVFAKDILMVGSTGFGILMAATYAGNFSAILYLTARPIQSNQGRKLLISVAGFGLCILIFGLSKNFYLSAIALYVSGLFDGVSMIIRGTILQLFVPDEMRGRVSSVNSIFINSSNELGQFESGVTADLMGTVRAVLFGGMMTLAVSTFTWFRFPKLKDFEW
jgi:MFS family permease